MARRQSLLSDGGWKCYWCQKPLTLRSMTIEHLVPKSRGGTNDPSNLATACDGCNGFRANRVHLTADQIARRDDREKKP